VVVPEANTGEARQVPDMEVVGARSLRQVLAFLRGAEIPEEPPESLLMPPAAVPVDPGLDLADSVLDSLDEVLPWLRRYKLIAEDGRPHTAAADF
jgi:hypothetical protein